MGSEWSAAQMPRLAGRRAVVTGATRGWLGLGTALELARAGAQVTLTARTEESGQEACARIAAQVPGAQVSWAWLDLASLASVRRFADERLARGEPLELLINNAGVMSLPTRQLTTDGFETQFGVNHLGHFALTGLLLPLLRKAPGARVVSLSSNLARLAKLDFANLQSEQRYSSQGAYEVSKLASLLFTRELHRRAPSDLLSVGAHPGIASTDLGRGFSGWIQKHLSQPAARGALSQLYAATAPDVAGGELYGPSGWLAMSGPPHHASLFPKALDPVAAERLWAVSEELTGVRYALPASGKAA